MLKGGLGIEGIIFWIFFSFPNIAAKGNYKIMKTWAIEAEPID